MSARKQFHWKVPLQLENGRTVTEDVRSYWSPEDDTTPSAIANAARVQAQARHKMLASPVGTPELVGV